VQFILIQPLCELTGVVHMFVFGEQRDGQLSAVEAQLSKLSLDSEQSMLAEMLRLDTAQREHLTSRCDELQQQLMRLTELTERCHADSITQMTSAVQQHLLAFTDTMSVLNEGRGLLC